MRVGIELAPTACRMIELDRPMSRPGDGETAVRAFGVLPRSGPELDTRLADLRRRQASVVAWGVGSDHRHVVVSGGSYEQMRAEALRIAASAGVQTRGTLADIAPAATAIKGARRQPVILALANAHDVSAAIQPLLDAGVRVVSVLTPADALVAIARTRRAFALQGAIEAYIALDESATCIALVRDGSLLSGRELMWGYANTSPTSGGPMPERRDDLAERIVAELDRFFADIGADPKAISQVNICGGLPELRTMTVPLMERLDVEVEPLDSLFGIDTEALPDPADVFREHAAELRLAWAAAADARPPINFLRQRRRQRARQLGGRSAIAAGVVAGVGLGIWIAQSDLLRSAVQAPTNARAGTTASTPKPSASAPTGLPAPPRTVRAEPSPPLASGPLVPPQATLVRPPEREPVVVAPPAGADAPPSVPSQAATPSTTPSVTRPGPTAPATRSAAPAVRPSPPAARPPVAAPAPRPTTPTARPPAPTPRPAAPPATRSAAPAVRPSPSTARPPVAAPAPRPTTPTARPPAPAPRPVVPAPPSATTAPSSVPAAAPRPVVPEARPSAPAPRPVNPVTPPAAPAARPSSSGAASSEPTPAVPQATAQPTKPSEPATAPTTRPAPALAPAPESQESDEAPTARPQRQAAPPTRAPLPFDATLGTILYSSDRRLAVINGRIVGVGDFVNGAQIINITPSVVLLRDAQGRLRSLTLGSASR